MAGRVNTRFVVMLSGLLIVVFIGVAAVGYVSLKGRPARWVAKADALSAQGEYDEAAQLYERAVGYDRTRVEWLEKWKNALVKTIPDNSVRYEKQYLFYRSILHQLGVLQARVPAAQLPYIEEVERSMRSGASREQIEKFITEIGERVRDLDPNDPITKKIVRMRAQAQTDRMAMIKVDDADRQAALAELEAAIAADPADHGARIHQIKWHLAEAERFRTEVNREEEAAVRAVVEQLIEKLARDMPGNPEVAFALLMAKRSDKLRFVDTPAERMAILQGMKDEALRVLDVALAAPPESLTIDVIDRLYGALSQFAPEESRPPLEALIDRALETHPNDARLMLAKGNILQETKRIEEAVAQFQQVIDLPDLPVSQEGFMLPMRRMTAMALQIDTALQQWNEAATEEDRAKALERAIAYRDRLVKDAGVRGKDIILLRDAKIAYAQRRYDESVAKLSELRSLGTGAGRTPEVLQLLGEALKLQGNFGVARDILTELAEVAPGYTQAQASLGEVYMRLGDIDAAEAHFALASKLDPGNKAYSTRLAEFAVLTGKKTPGDTVADPLLKGVIDARKLRDEGDFAGSRLKLDALVAEYPDDRRAFSDLVALDIREGNKEGALARVKANLEKFPTDPALKRMRTQLEIADPIEAAIAIINDTDDQSLPPAQKALERFNVYLNAGRVKEAEPELAEAERLTPEDPRVLDMAFVVALGKHDFAKAQRLAQNAAKLNIDQLDGLLYQGRVELVEGEEKPEKLQAAVATFETAVKRVPYNPSVRKLLAQAYLRAGRLPEASEAFKKAYEGKPDDVSVARDYANALLVMNRGREALEVIAPDTGVMRFFPANRELMMMWLELETRYGKREKALKQRQGIHTVEPTNLPNSIALAEIYLEDAKYDEAGTIIDEIEKLPKVNKLRIARMRSTLSARRGDIEGGKKYIQDVIASGLSGPEQTGAYLAMADYLRGVDQSEEAAAAMRQAQQTQSPEIMEADRALGDFYFDTGSQNSQKADAARARDEPEEAAALMKDSTERLSKASEYYESVIKALKDRPADSKLVRKRLTETYLRLSRCADADRVVGEILRTDSEDVQVILLGASIAECKGDRRAARQMYDKAVTQYPNNFNTFFQRALFNMQGPDDAARTAQLPDVLADLEAVCKLRPAMINAWLKRYSITQEMGQQDKAFAVLKDAIARNPDDDDLRLMLIKELAYAKRFEELQTELETTVKDRPEEVRWLRLAANVLATPGIDRWDDAADLLVRYYEKEPKPQNAGPLLDALLRSSKQPERKDVQKLAAEWEKIADPARLYDVMLRARIRTYTLQADVAAKHLDEAIALIGDDGRQALKFMNSLTLVHGGKAEKAMEWLKNKAAGKELIFNPYLSNILIVARRSSEPATTIMQELTSLLERTRDEYSQIEILHSLSGIAYANGNYKESAMTGGRAIALLEKDPANLATPLYAQLTNNVAYTLIEQLDDAKAGLVYAKKAADLAPGSSTVLDTLGWAHYKLKDYRESNKILARAAQLARIPDEGFVAHVHLAMSQMDSGDKGAARAALREAENLSARASVTQQPTYQKLLETLRKGLQ